ncbi:18S rRNA maturation protein [Mortierella sp. GBA30]|nr:18S rRNA maturation protein [Mortierella sp. GBA30]
MDAQEGSKKKWAWKVAPSKAPGRVLKKKLRDLERLIKNKDSLKDLPEEVIKETEKKIVEVQKQIEALGPQTSPADTQKQKKSGGATDKSSKGIKFTELRRAGRKIAAFKKQHPKYEESEEESKALADLELDLLYIKNFPKHEEYISIYPDSPLTDEDQLKTQADIRTKIEKAIVTGEIKKSSTSSQSSKAGSESTKTTGKHPASNWSDNDEDEDDGSEDDTEHPTKKQKSE